MYTALHKKYIIENPNKEQIYQNICYQSIIGDIVNDVSKLMMFYPIDRLDNIYVRKFDSHFRSL